MDSLKLMETTLTSTERSCFYELISMIIKNAIKWNACHGSSKKNTPHTHTQKNTTHKNIKYFPITT